MAMQADEIKNLILETFQDAKIKIDDLKGKWTHLKFHVLWKIDETGRFKIYRNNEVIADF